MFAKVFIAACFIMMVVVSGMLVFGDDFIAAEDHMNPKISDRPTP